MHKQRYWKKELTLSMVAETKRNHNWFIIERAFWKRKTIHQSNIQESSQQSAFDDVVEVFWLRKRFVFTEARGSSHFVVKRWMVK